MKYITEFSNEMSNIIGINDDYVYLVLLSLLVFIVLKIIGKIIVFSYKKIQRKSRELFIFNQRTNLIINIIIIIGIFLLWEKHLTNVVTIISFISAGVTIAIRDVIVNIFAGIYLKIKKPFKLEDRIEINGFKGDVVVMNALSFKILEVGDRINGEQSSGIIINVPNSFVFSNALKNYTTVFKYIWDEIIVKIPLDSDVECTKKEILKIVNQNEIVKSIPKKMDQAVQEASLEYRIYYNHLKPIIYTKVNENHIELYVRFLVHPKKTRNVEDDIWLKILKKYNDKKIDLLND